MKYCKNCGKPLEADELFCKSCGTKQDTVFEGFSDQPATYNTYYDDAPPIRLNKTMQIVIKVFLILTIIAVVISAGRYFVAGFMLNNDDFADEVIREIESDPEFVEMIEMVQIDAQQIVKVVQILCFVTAVIYLAPLLWVLPMRKKIVKAMKNGTTLTTGFKVCTLLFVNLIVGILLLCSKEI